MAENADLIAELRARIAELQSANRTLEAAQKELSGTLASAQGENKKLAKALEAAEATAAKVPELEKSFADVQGQIKTLGSEHAKALAARDAEHAQALAFTGAGVSDPAWRKVYAEHFAAQSDKGEKDIGKWIEGLHKADPATIENGVLRAAVQAHRKTDQPAPQPQPGNPWAGRGGTGFAPQNDGQGPASRPNTIGTPDQLAAILANPKNISQHAATLAATDPALAVLATPGFMAEN